MSTAARPVARAGVVLALVLACDQLTKIAVRAGIEPGEKDAVLPGLELVRVRNKGVAFGAFADGQAIVLVVVAVALVALLAWFATHRRARGAWLPTGLLLGGALGNLIDRVRDGAVTDFLKLPAWPAFNVADIAITFGVLSLLWVVETGHESAEPAP